ncbi:MAG: hypothetical protein U1E60_13425 [Reyranellaceae bacterium]
MRWIHLAIVVVLAAAALIFVFQNLELVTMSFLGFSARVPLALLAAVIYVAGALTGSSLLSLVRKSYERSKIGASSP